MFYCFRDMRPLSLTLLTSLILLSGLGRTEEPVNLLRNGSFEGGLRYWFDTEDKKLVHEDAATGEYCLRLEHGGVQSAAFELIPGKTVTISFSAKADGDTVMGLQCSPCGREIGVKAGLTWGMKAHHPFKVGTAWKRYSMTFTPNLSQDGFWPRPTYMLQFGDSDKPLFLDAITVSYGGGESAYVPYRAVEVQLNSPDLKGYKDESSNLLEKGQTVNLEGSVSNPGNTVRTLTLRWQLIDYEGERALNAPLEKKVTVAPGKLITESVPMKLSATGLVLARFSAFENGQLLDRSDLPLTTLPYPKTATKPDYRERFGCSIFGPHNAQSVHKIGMSWSRWYPHVNWADHQPKGADKWVWYDDKIDALGALGISVNAVLYGKPKWAFAKESDLLPIDMQWPATDPRWDDLSVSTGWDTFITTAVKHYAGKSLIYEIENEPEFDGWDKHNDLYTKFTIRTARLIKQADPGAKTMVDNVYGIPSGLNRYLLEHGAGKYIDIISWHDYHDGWLADAAAIKRMRAALEDLGCQQIEIWFNEGWAYTNSAVDEPAVALTHFNAAQSTNAMVDSLAELTVNGQEKTILFHSGYEDHGMSFWDYAGPGTMLWDYYGYPLPLVPGWNVLIHHIGLSKAVAFIRPEGANFCIFDDLRNGRGVMVAYADRDSKTDITVELPLTDMIAEDTMGNPAALEGNKLTLRKSGRPVFLYSANKTDGKTFAEKLTPLDRKNASFVTQGGASFRLPTAWEGSKKDSSDGNPASANGKPIWRLDQIWPADPLKPANYHRLSWREGWWLAEKDGLGGQPKVELKDGAIRMEFRASHSTSPGEKICGLIFIAPETNEFSLNGNVELKLWDGKNPVRLTVLRKSQESVTELSKIKLTVGQLAPVSLSTKLAAGDELVLLPRIEGMFTGGDITVRDLQVSQGSGAGVEYRLPRAWEGRQKGTYAGNPIEASGKALWRVDQLWPDNPIMAANYTPLLWNGTAWAPEKNGFGGQPEIRIEDGAVHVGERGPWTGNDGQRIAGLVFIAPKAGVYHISGSARTKPWSGEAKTYRLALYKKDTQRATEIQIFSLPRSGEPVALDFKVELTNGHELIFLPIMPDSNNATTTSVENLVIAVE